jgi:hypothetical protein
MYVCSRVRFQCSKETTKICLKAVHCVMQMRQRRDGFTHVEQNSIALIVQIKHSSVTISTQVCEDSVHRCP